MPLQIFRIGNADCRCKYWGLYTYPWNTNCNHFTNGIQLSLVKQLPNTIYWHQNNRITHVNAYLTWWTRNGFIGINRHYKINMTEQEGNVLFNDALNTFYLRLYGIRDIIKDHSDSEKGNPLLPHRLLFLISSKGAHTTTFVTLVVEHWLEQEIAHWVHHMKDRSDDPLHHERTLLPRSYILLHDRTVALL